MENIVVEKFIDEVKMGRKPAGANKQRIHAQSKCNHCQKTITASYLKEHTRRKHLPEFIEDLYQKVIKSISDKNDDLTSFTYKGAEHYDEL